MLTRRVSISFDILGDHLIDYGNDAPPVCVGHYWLSGEPARLAPNIACLDWSVAKKAGSLAAYRWDDEQPFYDSKFVWIYRQEQLTPRARSGAERFPGGTSWPSPWKRSISSSPAP